MNFTHAIIGCTLAVLAAAPAAADSIGAKGAAKIAAAAQGNASFVRAAKAAITATLIDPGSVQFRNLSVHRHQDGLMLCGELNAKNAMGGYSGFREFISSTGSMVYMGDQIEALWPEYCGAGNKPQTTSTSPALPKPDENPWENQPDEVRKAAGMPAR